MSIRFANPDLDEDLSLDREDEQNESQDEIADELPRIQPRHPRASLTHLAIKTELMKMNKQIPTQKLVDLSNEPEDESLSRAARKRKRRREKVLEERRASGRSEDLEDDFTNFKSVSIARRRSSVLPTNAVFHHHQDSQGCASYPQKSSCWARLKTICWWLLIIGTLVTVSVYVWPLLDTEPGPDDQVAPVSAAQESFVAAAEAIGAGTESPADVLTGGGSIDDGIDGESISDQPADIVSDSDAIGAIWFMLKEASDTFNSLLFDRDAALGKSNGDVAEEEGLAVEEEAKTNNDDQDDSSWWTFGFGTADTTSDESNNEAEEDLSTNSPAEDEDDLNEQDEQVPIELDVQTAMNGQHIDEEQDETTATEASATESFGWFWGTGEDELEVDQSELNEKEENVEEERGDQNEFSSTIEPEESIQTAHTLFNEAELTEEAKPQETPEDDANELLLKQLADQRQEMRELNDFNELEARELVDQLIEEEQQLDRLKEARQHLRSTMDEQEMFECDFETDPLLLETSPNPNCNDRQKSALLNQPEVTQSINEQSEPQIEIDSENNDPTNQTPTPNSIDTNPFYEYDPFFN